MLNERKLTKSELAKREDIIMKMKKNKRQLVQRYGKDAEKVMYGRATQLAKKQAEAMDQDRIKEMVKTALMGPVKEDQVEEANAFIVAADAARDAGKKEFEFPEGSGKMHPVKIKADIDEVDNSEYAMAVRASKAYKPGPKPSPKRFPKPKDASDLRKLDALEKRRAQIMRDMEQEAELEGGPIADRYGDMLNKLDKAIAMLKSPEEKEYTLREMSGDKMEALMELRNILDELQVLGDQARNIIANSFPSFLSQGEAYGAFDMGSSSNRYDTTLASIVADIEEYGDEEEDEDMMQEDLDLGHQDNEPHMLKADLYRIGKYAMELYQMLDKFEAGSEEVDLPHWWQSKIIKSKDAIVGAKHYLDFEIKEPQIDAMVDVAAEEDVVEKPLNEGTWSLGSAADIKGAIDTLEMMLDLDAEKIVAQFKDKDNENFFYNVVGDDLFHDDLDGAKREAEEGNLDRAHNRLIDAKGRAEELLAIVRERESSRPYPTDIFEDEIEEGLPKGYWDKKMDAEDEVNELLDDTPAPVVAKANNKIVNVATMAKSLLDIYDDFKAKEKIDFESNTNFRNALSFLTKAAQPQIDKETKGNVAEDYDALVNKIKKQGKSEKAAKAIAGAVASYKAKGGGKGPTAKQKARG